MTTNETITFMGNHWITVEDSTITIGIHEDSLEIIDEIETVDLPQEGESVEADDICCELSTSDGPINVYTPLAGAVSEINAAVKENPSLIKEDPYGDGWLFRIEVSDPDELNEFVTGANYET